MPLRSALLALVAVAGLSGMAAPEIPKSMTGMADILGQSTDAEWRTIDPENTVYLDLPSGRVVIELAPAFAPNHVANIKALARKGYFDGAYIVRSQDNYVVQWGRGEDDKRPVPPERAPLKAEFDRRIGPDLDFTALPDPDTYAPQVGYSKGFPTARNPSGGQTWLTHCYGMVGAGRDNDADSGGGSELYAVNGQAPRQLDRNVTLVGRVVQGMDLLSVLPRGTGAMGFYDKPEQRVPLTGMRVAADLPAAERLNLQALRTDSATFTRLVAFRRHRQDDWYKTPADRVDVCNVPLPIRRR
jgi:peptidylprolyl isomerase